MKVSIHFMTKVQKSHLHIVVLAKLTLKSKLKCFNIYNDILRYFIDIDWDPEENMQQFFAFVMCIHQWKNIDRNEVIFKLIVKTPMKDIRYEKKKISNVYPPLDRKWNATKRQNPPCPSLDHSF